MSSSPNHGRFFIPPSNNKIFKRRKLSPKIFPKKVHITEAVMSDFARLNITNPNNKQRTFSEIEDSLQLDNSDDDDEGVHPRVTLSASYAKEIRHFKYSLLRDVSKQPQSQKNKLLLTSSPKCSMRNHIPSSSTPRFNHSMSTAVVLYQPRADLLATATGIKTTTSSNNSSSSSSDDEDGDDDVFIKREPASLASTSPHQLHDEPMEL